MSKDEKKEVKAPKITLGEVMNKTGLTRNQLINLFTDIDLSEIAFTTQRLKIKALNEQRKNYFAQKNNLKESVEYRELMVRDQEIQVKLVGQQQFEKEISQKLLEQIWPMIVPPADMSGEDHTVITYLNKMKPIVTAKLK